MLHLHYIHTFTDFLKLIDPGLHVCLGGMLHQACDRIGERVWVMFRGHVLQRVSVCFAPIEDTILNALVARQKRLH